jgi:hypothetical protein
MNEGAQGSMNTKGTPLIKRTDILNLREGCVLNPGSIYVRSYAQQDVNRALTRILLDGKILFRTDTWEELLCLLEKEFDHSRVVDFA